ncbi:uncharacterized protein [Lolium perenne]|uniref:uncharacterized protein n=1 Tax=Lolium perenne TaxID=4522 RepID=UPI0021F67A54|nr:uncharacterized protein LOC127339286 [Lolium perenne]
MRKSLAVCALLELQAWLKPDVLFLSEAHLCKVKEESLKRRLLFDEMLVAGSDGRSGGLVFFWNNDITVSSKEVEQNFIGIRINENSEAGWRFIGFYGEPSSDTKHLSWDYIRSLHAAIDLPWIMVGDFNEIRYSNEKEGGASRSLRCMQAFRDVLNDRDLEDMGYEGDIFTWRRGKIRERLDRAVCNPRWADMFPIAGVVNEDFGLQAELNRVMSGPLSDEAISKQRDIQLKMENLSEQEELYWVQRGRVNWLQHGDQNTAFFHRFASGRRKRNFIKYLKNDSGEVTEDQDQIMDLASNYFQTLFTAEVQDPDPTVINKVLPSVTTEMNGKLLAPYSREEVKKALFNIGVMGFMLSSINDSGILFERILLMRFS